MSIKEKPFSLDQSKTTVLSLEESVAGQAESHADPYVRACYSQLISDPSLASILDITQGAMAERGMPAGFATNLLFRGIQSIERVHASGSRKPYPKGYESPLKWHTVMSRIVKDEAELTKLHEILLTKNTSTNIYERFMGPTSVAAHLFGDRPIGVADLGCSANYGLLGTAANIPFKELKKDDTHKIGELVDNRFNLLLGVGIDIEDPNTQEAKNWRRDCIYPSELNRERLRELDLFDNLNHDTAPNVAFVQADALNLPGQLGKFEMVVLSTMCYQLETDQQVAMVEGAKNILAPDGIIVVQDFAHKASKSTTAPMGVQFDNNWTPYSYRTFVMGRSTGNEMLEVLQWNNGRCEQVKKGVDFDRFFQGPAAPITHSKASSAA